MMTERLAFIDIGQMYFNKRNRDRQQSVAQRHAGMSERTGVKQDKVNAFKAGIMNAIDEFVLSIALQVQQVMTGIHTSAAQAFIDVVQRLITVNLRLAGAQQIEIGAVQD